ncbi:hypothetical protein [Micromonospora sp. HM5-17]|uniref:hypothetical protein n=1 Tax=Micromonospora sp. HM5-17 TaxID=2487710 RepID=UPI001F3E4838|nr:hypothetical protein [Micromonospora sp. HM5-17]
MTMYSGLMSIAVEAIERAGDIVRHELSGALTAKGDRDVASELDYRIERELRA